MPTRSIRNSRVFAAVLTSVVVGFGLALDTAEAQTGSREVLIGVSRLGGPQPATAESEAMYDRAVQILRTGDLSGGQRQLEQLVARFPDSPAATRARRDLAALYAGPKPQAVAPIQVQGAIGHLGASDVTPPPTGAWRTTVRPPAGFQRTAQDILRDAAGDLVFFSEGSAELGARARKSLSAQAEWLKSNVGVPVLVEGHADESGSPAELRALSIARAEAVRVRLVEEGVPAERIRIAGHGGDRRVALCTDRTCSSQNRRVVTVVGARATAQLP